MLVVCRHIFAVQFESTIYVLLSLYLVKCSLGGLKTCSFYDLVKDGNLCHMAYSFLKVPCSGCSLFCILFVL